MPKYLTEYYRSIAAAELSVGHAVFALSKHSGEISPRQTKKALRFYNSLRANIAQLEQTMIQKGLIATG